MKSKNYVYGSTVLFGLLVLNLYGMNSCQGLPDGTAARLASASELDTPANAGEQLTKAAKAALAGFELEPGFKIEIIAAEPLVADPVAMEIDENGSLYVVENHGYPLDKNNTSKIKLLRDTDGDGQMD